MIDVRSLRRLIRFVGSAAALVLSMPYHGDALGASTADATTWRTECGACHVAYPARMLSAQEWSRILLVLDQHYGVDASLDPADLAAVARDLRASPDARTAAAGASPPRITTRAWFRDEHDEVPARVWRQPDVQSLAN